MEHINDSPEIKTVDSKSLAYQESEKIFDQAWEDYQNGKITRKQFMESGGSTFVAAEYDEASDFFYYLIKRKGQTYRRKRFKHKISNKTGRRIFRFFFRKKNFIVLPKLVIMF